jgi:hypothetical protein
MRYARIHRNQLVYPTTADFIGIPNWQSNEPAMRRKRWLPLVGDPEPREGYAATPATWHVVTQSETRLEPRNEDPVTREPFIEIDPVTGEARQVTRIVPVEFDTSYIQVDTWSYVPIPIPEPEPVRYSKYKIQLACQKRGLWEQVKAAIEAAGMADSWANIQDIASDNPELIAALPSIRAAFGSDTVDAVLAESIAE